VTILKAEPRLADVVSVAVTNDELTAEFSDGRRVSVPLSWYPRLFHSTPEERNNWRLIGQGDGVHWPDLDEDISAANIIFGQPSGESQRSLGRWMKGRGTDGG
jgi:Protein of unknown function (DUF2442)